MASKVDHADAWSATDFETSTSPGSAGRLLKGHRIVWRA